MKFWDVLSCYISLLLVTNHQTCVLPYSFLGPEKLWAQLSWSLCLELWKAATNVASRVGQAASGGTSGGDVFRGSFRLLAGFWSFLAVALRTPAFSWVLAGGCLLSLEDIHKFLLREPSHRQLQCGSLFFPDQQVSNMIYQESCMYDFRWSIHLSNLYICHGFPKI